MPRIDFSRLDLQLILRRTEDGGVDVQVGMAKGLKRRSLPATLVNTWLKVASSENLTELPRILRLAGVLRAWQTRVRSGMRGLPETQRLLPRVTLDVPDGDLATLSWESSLAAAFSGLTRFAWTYEPIVRISPVRPRVASIPLTLPVRILQVDPAPGRSIVKYVRKIFGSHPSREVSQAVQCRECAFDEVKMPGRITRSTWPTVEVLHFDHLPTLEHSDKLLSTAHVETAGTLGWLSRLADLWQTRLIVVHCDSPQECVAARRLAAAILNRGGPAVLVGYFSVPLRGAGDFYEGFYGNLIHDSPLDECLHNMSGLFYDQQAPVQRRPSLFVGGGREEALRVSALGVGLLRWSVALSARKTRQTIAVVEEVRNLLRRTTRQLPPQQREPERRLENIRSSLQGMQQEWSMVKFEFHEGEGLLPLSRHVRALRGFAQLHEGAKLPEQARLVPGKRYVNSSFWSEAGDTLRRLPQKTARLQLGEMYHLGVQIGPKDEFVRTVGETALIEEVFKWTPDMTGVWIDVAITGLDFDVTGDSVQELWLPREGASDLIHFAVVPRSERVARLRFCLYFQQNLVQSFRVAALTQRTGTQGPVRKTHKKRLARALDIPLSQVGNVGYLPRLEYALTVAVEDIPTRPKRAVSLVANQLDGKPVITVKGADIFGVIRSGADLPDFVSEVRRVLQEISTPPLPGVNSELWPYGFGLRGQPNAATPEMLKTSLKRLATAGWQLFDAVVPGSERKKLEDALRAERQVIHVAHILLEKVIPWAAVYDRKYDADRQVDDTGQPIAHDVCLAPVPAADGKLPCAQCGVHAACLLHPDQLKRRRDAGQPALLPETVVCPLHFWGFKHVVEIPPQQVRDPSSGGHAQQLNILASGKAQMTAGINARLPMADAHVVQLEELANQPDKSALWTATESSRDRILKRLQDINLDLIYLYCHARGGQADPTVRRPYLEFQDKQQPQPGKITADELDFDQIWAHHPLVFLNGCGTVGFSPDALSPFIIKLVDDRGAAGVIGTEISVWEPLATEMAVRFLTSFLAGRPVGLALLDVRRALLAQNNPLGIVYTLYAAAELALDRKGKKRPD